MLKVIYSTLLLSLFFSTSVTWANPLHLELDNLVAETEAVMPRLSKWEDSEIKDKFLHRLNENMLLMKLAKDMDSRGIQTDHDDQFLAEVAALMDYQIGLLYVSYQVLDFAKSQRIPFAYILKRYPALKVDLHKALNQPVKIEYAKVLFDRWLYLGLVSRY